MCTLQSFLPSPAAPTGRTCSGGAGIAGAVAGSEYLHYVHYGRVVFAAYFPVHGTEARPCVERSHIVHLAGKVTFSHSQDSGE